MGGAQRLQKCRNIESFCDERAFPQLQRGGTFSRARARSRQTFLLCFARAEEFEPSRRAENSVPAFARAAGRSVSDYTRAGRTRRAAAQLN